MKNKSQPIYTRSNLSKIFQELKAGSCKESSFVLTCCVKVSYEYSFYLEIALTVYTMGCVRPA